MLKKVHKFAFTVDGETKESVIERLSKEIDRIFEEEKDEEKSINAFINAITDLVKEMVEDEDKTFAKKADNWRKCMLKKPLGDRRSFTVSYARALHDGMDDFARLIIEHSKLFEDNKEDK